MQMLKTKIIRIDDLIDWTKVPGTSIELPSNIPKIGETRNSKSDEIILFAKFFKVHLSWFIAEKTNDECFGFIHNLADPELSEWGYFTLEQLQNINAEQDKYFKPISFKELKNKLLKSS